MEMLNRAIDFAVERHKGQYRKNSDLPYVSHCFDVMKQLSILLARDSEWYENILCAAMLHDTIEDCGVSFDVLKDEFNETIATWVLECSRDAGHESKRQKLDFLLSFRNKSHASIAIKIADRYCNVQDYKNDGKVDYAMWYAFQAYPLYQIQNHVSALKFMQVLVFDLTCDIGSAFPKSPIIFKTSENDLETIALGGVQALRVLEESSKV